MRSSHLACAALLVLSLSARAESERPAVKRLPEWLDAMLSTCESRGIKYDTITLSVPDDPDAKQDQGKVEVESPEKFWRLAPLVELRAGEARMNNITPPEGRHKSQVLFEVALEPPTIRDNEIEKLRSATDDLAKLADHLVADSSVHLMQLLASRPTSITVFHNPVHRLPVRFVLTGPRAAVLSRLAQLPAVLPYAYARSLRAVPGAQLTVMAAYNLLQKPAAPQPTTASAADLQRTAATTLGASGADVKIAISSPANADATILSLKGTAKDVAAARATLLGAAALPGLRAFDELGWRDANGSLELTGLLHFGP
jgi:hypothetical protein